MGVDDTTGMKARLDFALILIEVNHPLSDPFVLPMEYEGQTISLLVEKDHESYDYGCVPTMPST